MMSDVLWNIQAKDNSEIVEELSQQLPYSKLFIQLCLNRGLNTKESIEHFIKPDETWIHDPFLLFDMDTLVQRIFKAIEQDEAILIYGDYDADGVTSTSIMYETLMTLGANVSYYIPNRFIDGYGPNKERYKQIIDEGCQLIVTVDNGVAGHEAIDYANERGVDVIVTDHHELPNDLPNAYAIVHPKHPNGEYPFGELAGAGVALKCAHALLEEMPVEFFDLAAIGTIADMVSLTDENRAIATFGLAQMKQTQRMGLRRLITDLEVKLSEVDEQTIGFKVGPVMNAIGRLDHADPVVELLTSFDEERIAAISKELIQINEERKDIVKSIVSQAMDQVDPTDEINILSHPDWHEGVLGIVASNVVRETGKPTIILREFPDKQLAKGSARSVDNYDLFQACNSKRDLFTHFGGHKMAAGMTLPIENIELLKTHLTNEMLTLKETMEVKPTLHIDSTVNVDEVTLDMITEFDLLKPFGMDNQSPLFAFIDAKAAQSRKIGKDKDHLKLAIASDVQPLDSIGFSYGHLDNYITESSKLDIVGSLEVNEWNGNKKPQLMIEDIRIKTPMLIDKRTSSLTKQMLANEQTDYVCFKANTQEAIQSLIPKSSKAILAEDFQSNSKSNIVIVDCPDTLKELEDLSVQLINHEFTVYFYKSYSAYLNGLPTKKQCGEVYKYLASHPNLPMDNLKKTLTDYLKLKKFTFNLILKMFLEVNFVKIKDGQLLFMPTNEKVDLFNTATYKRYQSIMAVEQQLLFSSKDELVRLFSQMNEKANNEEKK